MTNEESQEGSEPKRRVDDLLILQDELALASTGVSLTHLAIPQSND